MSLAPEAAAAASREGPDVILVNYRCAADTLAALASLAGQPHGDVHVVDNSVDEAEAQALREGLRGQPAVRLHVADENLGFGRACNLAYAESRAPWVLLLNPDARLRPGALAQLGAALQALPRCAGVAPRMDWTDEGHLVLPNLSSQSPAARIEQAWASRWAPWAPRAFARRAARHAQRCIALLQAAQPLPVPALSGAVLLLRREAVDAAGGLFDPAYFMFFEDMDLSLRLRAAGWQLAVEPRARAWHAWRHRADKAALMAQSERVFLQRHHRWGDALQRRLVPWLLADAWRGDARPVPRVQSLEEARRIVGPLRALTPLPCLHPAAVRGDGQLRELSMAEWALLDNGRWHAWVDNDPSKPWLRFDVDRKDMPHG